MKKREQFAQNSFDSSTINESALINLVKKFEDHRYSRDNIYYPYELPGVSLSQGPPHTTNCCTFVEALLVKAWADNNRDFKWNSHCHAQMMINSDDLFAPVTVTVDSGMAEEVSADSLPGPWTIVQGWHVLGKQGHTFLVVDYHEPTGRVLTLEANSAYKMDGVGFRNIGNIKEFGCKPPENWWEREDLWTWDRLKSYYPDLKQARLKVKNLSWSRGDHESTESNQKAHYYPLSNSSKSNATTTTSYTRSASNAKRDTRTTSSESRRKGARRPTENKTKQDPTMKTTRGKRLTRAKTMGVSAGTTVKRETGKKRGKKRIVRKQSNGMRTPRKSSFQKA